MFNWEAIIPGYNVATLSEIAGFTPYLGFLVLGLLIPVISSIAYLLLIALHVVNCLKISEAFGKDVGFAIGMMFLPFIFYPMLAFDQEAKYNSDYKYKGVGFSNYTNGSSTTNNNNTFYAENMNNTQEAQSEAQSQEQAQEQNPVESTNTVDTNVDPIQYNENNNSESNNNGQW